MLSKATDGSSTKSLKLALLGQGKMGRMIARLATERGFQVQQTLSSESNREGAGMTEGKFRGIDVCLDFTTPTVVVDNIRRAATLGCNLVVGTTGWYDRLDEAHEIINRCGVGMVYAANFSLGIQLFYRVAQSTARILSEFPSYEPYLTESHHRLKKDAPSGTALELKRQIEPWFGDRPIPVASVRAGCIPGTHEFGVDAESETILLRHTVRSRQVFAEGALYAARRVVHLKGLYHFSDIVQAKEER